ncbi:hypothetical protein TNCV_3284391 [Trichonephila clavipes]|nr:hypothetical protein TNCV_3284391 [Trichonephila clavipes]
MFDSRSIVNPTPLGHADTPKKVGIEAFPAGSPHMNTIVITVEIESELVSKDDLVQFQGAVSFFVLTFPKRRRRWRWSVNGSTRNGATIPNIPSVRRFRMVREDTSASSEGDTAFLNSGG